MLLQELKFSEKKIAAGIGFVGWVELPIASILRSLLNVPAILLTAL